MARSYPYVELTPAELEAKEAEEADDLDDEDLFPFGTIPKLSSFLVVPTDHLAGRSVNPFYFAAGNTKLSEALDRTPVGNSMVPFPGSYPLSIGGQRVSPTRYMGPTSGFGVSTATRPTGSRVGWSSPHKSLKAIDHHIEDLDDVPDRKDLDVRHVEDLKQLIKLVLLDELVGR